MNTIAITLFLAQINILGALVALVVVLLFLWAVKKIIAAFAVGDPAATLIWVFAVILAVLVAIQMSGLYHFNI